MKNIDIQFLAEYEYADGLRMGRAKSDPPPVVRAGHLVVVVKCVPASRFDGHQPKTDVIWQAEEALMKSIENDLPPGVVLLHWRLFRSSKKGPVVSEYFLHQEDELRVSMSHKSSFHRTT